MAALSARVLEAIQDPGERTPEERIVRIIRAVSLSYGERPQVHRIVLAHSLGRGSGRLRPLIDHLAALLTVEDRLAGGGRATPFSSADAFVLTNAFAGVMRARILWQDEAALPQEAMEEALVRLIVNFVGSRSEA